MSGQMEVILSGVGGQGLIVCGTLMGEAVALYDYHNATMASEYGVETRGTFTKSDLIISDEEIFYPEAIHPNVILTLAPVAYERYIDTLESDTLLIYNSNEVKDVREGVKNQIGYPISEMAKQAGHPATANIISLGIVAGKIHIISREAAHKAIRNFFARKSEKVVQMNLKAFDMGYQLS